LDNALTTHDTGGAVATYGSYDPYSSYGQEAAAGGGNYLKFSKGDYLLGQAEEEVKEGTRAAANMAEFTIGWVKWKDKRPVERRMGLLAQGYKPEPRNALGDLDETQWDTDKDGKPQDPWQMTNELPLVTLDGEEQMTFSTSSRGGIGALGLLCKEYGKEYRLREGKVPVIELAVDSYKHTDYGKVYVPKFPIVDWIDNVAPAPAASGEAEEAREEPKAPKAASTAKASGSKTRF